jgi:hypothetical protein
MFSIGIYLMVSLIVYIDAQDIPEKVIRPKASITSTCLDIIHSNITTAERCEFFKCFEERFPCGDNYYMSNWAYKYCKKYTSEKFLSSLTKSGVDMVGYLNQCLPQKLESLYKSKRSLKCRHFYQIGFNLQYNCYKEIQDVFCVGFNENKYEFIKEFDKQDLTNGNMAITMLKLTRNCDPPIDLYSIVFQG